MQELGALDRLTAELQSNLGELRRLRHLLSHPAVLEWMQSSEQEPPPGPPPGLDDAEAMTRWIGSARDAYRRYQRWYASEHDTWWKQHGATGALQWEPPRIAQAAAVGLKPLTQQLEACRQRALATRCRGLADLDYQPVCHCGFDGKTAPFAEPLERADELRRTIESQLRLFFQQASVKKQLHRWNDEAIERTPELLAYLRDERPYPEVQRVSLLERHLAGLDLVRTISLRELAPVVGRQSWEPAALAQALGRWLTALGADRVRFVEPDGDASTSRERELSRWCLEQALRHGAALPPGCLDPVVANELAEQIDAAQVSPAALAGLDGLGLPDPLVERILSLVADGQLSVAHDGQAPLAGAVGAARELAEPSTPCSVDALASLSARLYEQHQRIVRLRREPWLARLEALALSALSDEPPSLVQVLRAQQPAQWILVDALGLPLRDALFDWLQQRLTAWQVKAVGCARVATPTTTAVALSDLAGEGINHPIDKIDVLDRLLHERFVPLADLLRLALAELELVLKPIVRRLNVRRPLFVFADHGFRIAAHGGSYTHGGASTLEQVVPTLLLEPRVGGVLTAS